MPLNCPLSLGEDNVCEGCRYIWGDKCNWFFPAEPIINILTIEERMARLERGGIASEIHYIPVEPPIADANTRRGLRQLKYEQVDIRNKLNELSQHKAKESKY